MDALNGSTSPSRLTRPATATPPGIQTAASSSIPSSSPVKPHADIVELSTGRATMLSRLFGVTDAAANPGIYRPGSAPAVGSVYMFLTDTDRETIASAYDFAQANGIDPRKVDGLAFDLACYRRSPSSSYVDSVGKTFDESGNPLLAQFDDADESAAQRILTSKAIKDSALPEDFLRHKLDPGFSPVHAVDFGFLEQIVYATSHSGSRDATDPNAVLAPRPKERLAQMQSAGTVPSPEEVRNSLFPGTANNKNDDVARYAARMGYATSLMSDTYKQVIASLYASTEPRHGAVSPDMTEIDDFVHALVASRTLNHTDN